jgi:hypothetical protein
MMHKDRSLHSRLFTLAASGVTAIAFAACATQQPLFATPEAAVLEFVAALRADDLSRLEALLGPDSHDILYSGDDVADREARQWCVAAYEEKNRLEAIEGGSGAMRLSIGKEDWPVPIPLVPDGIRWRFDGAAGRDEMLARRVGRNELNAIEVCLACNDAQMEYAENDRDGDGILEYAPRFRSTAGQQDGLYWATKEGETPSPLGELAAQAVREGYSGGGGDGPHPYHGYLFRILTAQGEHATGGAMDYVVQGSMIGGHALVAYPAEYGVSGIMTFVVNHEGVVYQKDLGDETEKLAEAMKVFDPDSTWRKAQ